ncbi:MAG: hypothetical protein J5847_00210 [Clostridia bacterium]|nr:hypothetical protein [Clostridia bacterium]
MAKRFSMGYFADGNGAMEGVQYAEDFAELQNALQEQTGTLEEYMTNMNDRLDEDEERLSSLLEENIQVMREVSRQLDVLTELVGEIGAKLGEAK